ncbi:MAG: hypothetical protein LQ338_005999 [Usnochroma carphineum]|nr:MAG: hypothetical protein LQ338_005999 [Usnochroma carphineum]
MASAALTSCLEVFGELITAVTEPSYEYAEHVPVAAWSGEMGNLRTWASEIGKFNVGKFSLDARLARTHKDGRDDILQTLDDLEQELNKVIHFLEHGPLPENQSTDPDNPEEEDDEDDEVPDEEDFNVGDSPDAITSSQFICREKFQIISDIIDNLDGKTSLIPEAQ